jgi:hypothetical protein
VNKHAVRRLKVDKAEAIRLACEKAKVEARKYLNKARAEVAQVRSKAFYASPSNFVRQLNTVLKDEKAYKDDEKELAEALAAVEAAFKRVEIACDRLARPRPTPR